MNAALGPDRSARVVFLVGGREDHVGGEEEPLLFDDVWQWDGAEWHPVPLAPESPRSPAGAPVFGGEIRTGRARWYMNRRGERPEAWDLVRAPR